MSNIFTWSNKIADIVGRWSNWWYSGPTSRTTFPPLEEVLLATPYQQRTFVVEALAWLQDPKNNNGSRFVLAMSVSTLLRRPLPFSHDDVIAFLRLEQHHPYVYNIEPHLPKIIATYLATNARTPLLDEALIELIQTLEGRVSNANERRRLLKLKELAGIVRTDLPILRGDPWADTALADIAALTPDQRTLWATLLQHCAAASGSSPTAKWQKTAQTLIKRLGEAHVQELRLRWLQLADKLRPHPITDQWGILRHPSVMEQRNADTLRGLIWLCSDAPDRETAKVLATLAKTFYRKLPGSGPCAPKLANAALLALSTMPEQHGMVQLALLKSRLRTPSAQKQVTAALTRAAERAGVTISELEELLVPTYGLSAVGQYCEQFGDYTAALIIDHGVSLHFSRADGRKLATIPRELKAHYGEAIAELTKAAADIRSMLPVQRDRIERSYLQQKRWPVAHWYEHYLNHPLIGTFARRLIWCFTTANTNITGIWHHNQLIAVDGTSIEHLPAETTVTLWHPLESTVAEILAWREWLVVNEIQQPFKQAYREIYLLTDAERLTQHYSNRFAAHILRQHQFNALCAARDWKNQLRLLVDDAYHPAYRLLPEWGIRAEYWIEGVGDQYGQDTNATGTFLYVATDQVRFYPLTTIPGSAHASGGGYMQPYKTNYDSDPIPLEQIPPLVLSEILRDVDLFVGVASVGNDPTWNDGGSNGHYRDYWQGYAFGDLSETAKTRHAVLERLLPRLKIAPRCHLTERFLVVRGNIRTYKIHLGSGNILMEPNDQYLCIVPARGTAQSDGMRFLPFEGDGTLAVILSKAFLLADDTKITDTSITRQLRL
jgi:hypothetical protein